MCKWGNTTDVWVRIPSDLSCDGSQKWKQAKIDTCISDLVAALQLGRIDMRGSCCGHRSGVGDIHLQDGRSLIVLNERMASLFYVSRCRFWIAALLHEIKCILHRRLHS